MAFQRPSLSAIQNSAITNLAGYLNEQPLFSSNEFVLTQVFSAMIDAEYSFVDYCFQQTTPFTATGEYLAAWAALKGVVRNGSTPAVGGGIFFTGTAGTTIAAGTLLAGSNGLQYSTNSQYIIGSSSPISATCVTPGSAGNAPVGISFTTVSSLIGVSATYSNAAFTGGTDIEGDSSLTTRMLKAYATTPSGGNVNDYTVWAYSTPGVTRAWCLPNYLGLSQASGNVTIFTMFDNNNISTSGFPIGSAGCSPNENYGNPRGTVATGDLLTVANTVQTYQPVTAFVWSMSPNQTNVSVTVAGTGTTNSWSAGTWTSTPTTAQTNILLALQNSLVLYGTALGGTIQTSAIDGAIASVLGNTTFSIVSPTSAITTPIGSIPVLHNLIVEV